MGNEIVGVDIAGIIADVFKGELLTATVTKMVEGPRDPARLTAGKVKVPATFENITGFWEDYTGQPPPGVTVELGDRKAVLIGDTIPVGGIPERGSLITMEGDTLAVVQLQSRDPAAAVYVYQCRDQGKLLTPEQIAAIEAAVDNG